MTSMLYEGFKKVQSVSLSSWVWGVVEAWGQWGFCAGGGPVSSLQWGIYSGDKWSSTGEAWAGPGPP